MVCLNRQMKSHKTGIALTEALQTCQRCAQASFVVILTVRILKIFQCKEKSAIIRIINDTFSTLYKLPSLKDARRSNIPRDEEVEKLFIFCYYLGLALFMM